jgi:hypothetical protein
MDWTTWLPRLHLGVIGHRRGAEADMLRLAAAGFFVLLFMGTRPAPAAECYPHCDYNHYYGPYDFTYVRPGLFGYPRCGPRGDCSPVLDYSVAGVRRGNITIRFLPRRDRTRPPS